MSEVTVIEAQNSTKYYGDFLAVDHISFKVEQGEIFGLRNPNRVDKTTTVRMLTGISMPSDSWAKIKGYDRQKQPVQVKEADIV